MNTMVTEDVYVPTDPLLGTLMIPTFPQLQPQPQTIESTSNETSLDNPNQKHVATESYGFKPHSMPTMESTEPIPQEIATLTSTLKIEPLLLQLATPITSQAIPLDHAQHHLTSRPSEYTSWSYSKKYRWRQRFEPK